MGIIKNMALYQGFCLKQSELLIQIKREISINTQISSNQNI